VGFSSPRPDEGTKIRESRGEMNAARYWIVRS
jgi:hypothetical protein